MCWRSPGAAFQITREQGTEAVHDGVRFDDTGEWFAFDAKATSADAELPEVRMRVSVPAVALSPQTALEVANDINRLGLAPVYFDEAAKLLVVQHAVVFTGFHETGGAELDVGLAAARREATVNMLAAAFAAARACVQAIQPNEGAPEPALQPLDRASPELLDAFSTFVISRMYRWEVATVRQDGGARRLLLEAATCCLVTDTIEQGEGDPAAPVRRAEEEPAARGRVDRWLRDRQFLVQSDAAHLDAILFDVDRRARQDLRAVMADPPNARPLRQLRLLERALADRRANWEGLQIEEGNLRAALALGLDVAIEQVPGAFAERLSQRYAFLAPRPGGRSVVVPQRNWLTQTPIGP